MKYPKQASSPKAIFKPESDTLSNKQTKMVENILEQRVQKLQTEFFAKQRQLDGEREARAIEREAKVEREIEKIQAKIMER